VAIGILQLVFGLGLTKDNELGTFSFVLVPFVVSTKYKPAVLGSSVTSDTKTGHKGGSDVTLGVGVLDDVIEGVGVFVDVFVGVTVGVCVVVQVGVGVCVVVQVGVGVCVVVEVGVGGTQLQVPLYVIFVTC
jgi:hypothetical protein